MRGPSVRAWLALVLAPVALAGQGRDDGREALRGGASPLMLNLPYDGTWSFARIRYAPPLAAGFSRGRGMAWAHDYPRAEANFSRILAEVSTVAARSDRSAVLTLDDPRLFEHPIAYIVEVGDWAPTEAEVTALRRWLARGGFLIVDDFQSFDWNNFAFQMGRVLPGRRLLPVPPTHPVFDAFYRITSFDDVRHPYSGVATTFWGIFEDDDPTKRLQLIANRDGDIAEFWEFSDQGFFPVDRANDAYKLGINYIVYALTR